MFGPLDPEETFTVEDFNLIESLLHSSATEEIQEATRKIQLEPLKSKIFCSYTNLVISISECFSHKFDTKGA